MRKIRYDRVFGVLFLLAWVPFVLAFCNYHNTITKSEPTVWLGIFGGIAITVLVIGNMLDKRK